MENEVKVQQCTLPAHLCRGTMNGIIFAAHVGAGSNPVDNCTELVSQRASATADSAGPALSAFFIEVRLGDLGDLPAEIAFPSGKSADGSQ